MTDDGVDGGGPATVSVPVTAPAASPPPLDQLRRWLWVVLLVIALVYLPSLSADFVNVDDDAYVTHNADVQHPQLAKILDPRDLTVSDWTPMVTLSHALEYRLFGLAPLPYHATNLLLHLACTALVYLLFRDLGVAPVECLGAALLFGIHPLQVESVAWVSSRKNLLAALFGLIFLRSFLAGRPLIATGSLALALGSKGTAVVFPLWAAAAVGFGFGRISLRRALPWLGFFGALALGRGLLSTVAQAPVIAIRSSGHMDLVQRMAVTGAVLATQVRQFFMPYGLSLRYDWPALRWSNPTVLASWTLLGLVAAALVWRARRDRELALAGCFTVLGLLPTLNIVPAPFFQADRYTHLALVGGALLAMKLIRRLARTHPMLPIATVALWCVVVAAPFTYARVMVWHNSHSLWQDTLRGRPDSTFSLNMLAKDYLDHHQLAEAQPVLRRVLALDPADPDARYNLALLLFNSGAADDAAGELRTLLRQHPGHGDGHCLLGRILAAQGQTTEALAQLDAALRLEPKHVVARYARARLYAQQGQLDAASHDLEALIDGGNTPAAVWIELARLRLQQGRAADAVLLARRATEQDGRFADAWDMLAQALLAVGDVDAADAAARKGLAANAAFPDLHYHLAEICARRGDHGGARAAASEALRLLGSAQRPWVPQARTLAGAAASAN